MSFIHSRNICWVPLVCQEWCWTLWAIGIRQTVVRCSRAALFNTEATCHMWLLQFNSFVAFATFQVSILNSHVWLVAAILESTDTRQKVTERSFPLSVFLTPSAGLFLAHFHLLHGLKALLLFSRLMLSWASWTRALAEGVYGKYFD